jgi:hypothetical protein
MTFVNFNSITSQAFIAQGKRRTLGWWRRARIDHAEEILFLFRVLLRMGSSIHWGPIPLQLASTFAVCHWNIYRIVILFTYIAGCCGRHSLAVEILN